MPLLQTARRGNAPTVNAGSMADIAFLLLIFFLVTTEIVEENGLFVALPPFDEIIIVTPQSEEKTLTILVNYQNELLVEGEQLELADLQQRVHDHLLDERWGPTEAIVSFRPDRGTDYETYLTAYNEILAAYRGLRDERAQAHYGLAFAELDRARKMVIKQEVPVRLSEAELSDYAKSASVD